MGLGVDRCESYLAATVNLGVLLVGSSIKGRMVFIR